MPIRFETRLRAVFVAAALCAALLAMITWRVGVDATVATSAVSHSHEMLTGLARVRADTAQIELSTQSFRISGDVARLQERDAFVASREQILGRLRQQLADHPHQMAQWSQLRRVIDERLAISRRVEDLRKTQGVEAANAYVASAPLQATRRHSYQLMQDMESGLRGLLDQRLAQQLDTRQRLIWLGGALFLFVATMLWTAYGLVHRNSLQCALARQQLADSEEHLATTLLSIGDGVIATDAQGLVTRMNHVAERLTGWPLAQALGRPVVDVFHIIHEITRKPATVPVAQVLASGEAQGLDAHTVLVARDGQECPIADSAAPIRSGHGAVRGVVIVFRDDSLARQTERLILDQNRQLEQRVVERTGAMLEAQQHLHNVINGIPALIAYVTDQQRYAYVNAQYLERFAPDRDDITGCSVREVLGEARYAVAAPLIEQVLQGAPQSYDWEPFPGVWQSISYLPRRRADGQVEGYFVLGTDITARRQSEEALRASQQQLARVLEGSDQGYWEWNLQTDAFQVSPRWETMLGYEPGEMLVGTEHWPEIVHPDDLPATLLLIQRHFRGESEVHQAEMRCKTKDGHWKWIQSSGRIVTRTPDGSPLLMSGTHTDIDERKRLELAQREASVVFENSYEAIMVADANGLIIKVNPAFTRITGYTEDEVRGRSPRVLASGRHDQAFYQLFWQSLTQDGIWRGEVWNQRKSGEMFLAMESISVGRDAQGRVQHYVSVFTDITQLKAHEHELDHVAHYDALTDLPNRRLLSDRLRQAILRSDRSGKLSAICFLDLDGFKLINDRYGHAVGDGLLVGVSEHLQQVLRADDTLARLGGDEFVLILSEVASPEECAQILDRVLHTVRLPVQAASDVQLVTSASIGVSLYPADNADPDTLLRHADQAMYMAKLAGKNRYQMFDPEIDRCTQARRNFLQGLRAALERQEFVLFYQPKVNLVDGQMVGAEALIRWQHPTEGLLPPAAFLPQLSGTELEVPLGEWVIETALTQAASWRRQGHDIHVSINVSADHLLQPDFCERLQQALQRHVDVPADHLELEVLETAAIGDMQQAVDVLQRCIGLGVRFSLDDFGTGYSSLTYLRKLPVHSLKIDQSFVRDMLADPEDLGIVQGVIELAEAFHREVIAEGVETLAHGSVLRKMGCHIAQGYGIAKPMPADALPAWCAQWLAAGAWRGL
jgi:diguanylate cyclase (GGDEF)-like protein/PAS domain S-box-containing protein